MKTLLYKRLLHQHCRFVKRLVLLVGVLLTSCAVTKLNTSDVIYQSIRQVDTQRECPSGAKICLTCYVSESGTLGVSVQNLTSVIMIIDQTKSFFINDGKSVSYYDPTVVVTSNTDYSGSTGGAAVNLGAVAGALGVGGRVGMLLGGVNVGGSSTDANSVTTTVTKSDLPQLSIGPRGSIALSKAFQISGVGYKEMGNRPAFNPQMTANNSSVCFSVCISYSLDGGKSFQTAEADFYANSHMTSHVQKKGKVNDALRRIFKVKPDALSEPCNILYFRNNVKGNNVYDLIRGDNVFRKYE
mgnify:CR=1 FL=1